MPVELARTVHEHYIQYDAVEDGQVVFSIGVPADAELDGLHDVLDEAGFTLEDYRENPDVLIEAMRHIVAAILLELY